MAFSNRLVSLALSGISLLLLSPAHLWAQGPPGRPNMTPPGPIANRQSAEALAPAPAPQQIASAALPAATVAPSMLQQPAREAKIVFAGDTLTIHADNSSLTNILRSFATRSGMKIEGLGGDERVFGSFGPGSPRDVLADLLHGTTYNLVLLGDLGNGAPRELILTPTTHGGAAPAATPQGKADQADGADPADPSVSDQPSQEPEQEIQGPLDLPTPVEDPPTPPGTAGPSTPGVKTPQQLFEQLQQMRQAQQNASPDTTQQDPPQQDPQPQQ